MLTSYIKLSEEEIQASLRVYSENNIFFQFSVLCVEVVGVA